ncbi:hypothetical protein ES703_110978 [subsurface metagenome]
MVSTIFSDIIVSPTDLRKNQKYLLDGAYDKPITVKHGHKQLAILRREQVNHMIMVQYYADLIVRYCQEIHSGERKSVVFPWMDTLDDEEREEFLNELLVEFRNSIERSNWSRLAQVLDEWKATAEAKRNPEIIKLLQNIDSPREYVVLDR